MDHREYCAQLSTIQTSAETVDDKTRALKRLEKKYLTQKEKMNNILVSISQSSPDVPNAFNSNEGADDS